MNKCILCGLCVRACNELPGKDNLDFANRGFDRKATTYGDVHIWNQTAPFVEPV